jgi:hypothetical protein
MPRKPKQRLNLLKLAAQKLKLETSDGRRLSKREIGVIKLVNRFVETGDPKIFMTLIEIVHQGGRPEITYRAHPEDVTEWTDNEVFEAFNAFRDHDFPAAWEN